MKLFGNEENRTLYYYICHHIISFIIMHVILVLYFYL